LGLAFMQYIQDNDELYPCGTNLDYAYTPPTPYANPAGWAGEIYPYVKSTGVFHCPDDPTGTTTGNNGTPFTATYYPISYEANTNIMNLTHVKPNGQPASDASFGSVAKTILLIEIQEDQTDMTDTNGVPETVSPSTFGTPGNISAGKIGGKQGKCYLATGQMRGSTNVVGGKTGNLVSLTGVHQNMSNFLFADGHAKAMHGMAVSVGYSNPVIGDCTTYQGLNNNNGTKASPYAANSQCGDQALGGTFSVY
jgi:prepilin-type processing-associated H-X9-DG protein